MIKLSGHTIDMVGYRTKKGTIFLGDAFTKKEKLDKYKVWYNFDIKSSIDTLHNIYEFNAFNYLPSHGDLIQKIKEIVKLNLEYTNKIIEYLLTILREKLTYENILEKLFKYFDINMDIKQNII